MLRTEHTFHKDLPVTIRRKRMFRKSHPCRAIMSDISRHGGRLLCREPLIAGYQILISLLDPDSQTERDLSARVVKVGILEYHGSQLFQATVEFVGLTRRDTIMLENLFYI